MNWNDDKNSIIIILVIVIIFAFFISLKRDSGKQNFYPEDEPIENSYNP